MKVCRTSERTVVFQEEIEGYPTASVLIVLEDRNLVVDTLASPGQMRPVFNWLQQEGRDRLATWVINTHHHWDHVWGNQAFAGCPILAHALCRQRMDREGRETLRRFQAEKEGYGEVRLTLPNLVFSERMTLHTGGCTVELRHFPSHSDDEILIYLPEEETLLAGDALEVPFPMLEWEGGSEPYLKGLTELRTLSVRTVIPSHGPVSGPELIERNYRYVERVWQAASDAVRRGAGPEELKGIAQETLAELGFANVRQEDRDTHLRNLERAFLDARETGKGR